ncbi:MAG: filamentous hemagglutinin N-terminal domain-containing protein, partial [Pseudomonas sp.]
MSVSMKTTTARVALGTVLMGAVPMAPLVPTAIAQAIAQVIADPNAAAANRPTMHESLNKTPVQNIVAPNASGLSHNKLQEFNVDQRNLIINNSRVNAISNLGGAVVANPNLANGEARIILNEVTGGNRSILQGNQELLGGRAAYILANPNGITCAGCGFLNFPRVTMTTGVPVINGDVLNGFRVNGGDISIGGAGLNAEGIDAFDILTRSVTFAGQVNTRALNVVAGRNDVDYDTLAATALTDAPATPAPSWAIDSSALGGMYAGRIALVSTEAGVGVRLQGGAAATVDDVTLTSAGQIQIKSDVSAERDVKLVSTQAASVAGAEVLVDGATVYAKRDATLSGGDVVLTGGRLGSGQALSITGASLTDNGGLRDAGSTLTVSVSGAMDLLNTALRSTGHATITAGSLSVDAASNDGGAKGLRSGGALTVNVSGTVDNAGLIAGDGGLTLTAAQLDNASTGLIRAGDTAPANATVTVTGAITQLGTVSSTGNMTATATSLTNSGTVQAGGAMSLNVGTVNNTATELQDAYITSVGNLTLGQNNKLYNTASTAKRAIIASTAGALGINSTSGTQSTQEVRNQGGLLFGKTGMTVAVSRQLLNEVANGRRGSIYADTGTMTLGGVNQAAIDAAGTAITVKNLDSDIENRLGSINILADVFENSAAAYMPDKTTATTSRSWGSFDYDGTLDGAGDLIGVEGDCGTYGDHFDGGVVGKRCTQSVTVTQEVLTNGTTMRSKLLAGGSIDIYVGDKALNYISAISAGGNIKIHGSAGATFENRAVTLKHSEQAQVWRYDHGGQTLNPAGDCYSSGTYNRCWFESGDFVPNKRKKFTDISLASAPTRYTIGVGSTVEAGGTVTISVSELVNVNNGTKKALAPPSTSPSTQTASGPTAAPLAAIGSLTQSPFFVPSVNPNALFLFETDPKLMSLEGLYGSDLFLKSLNLDPTDYLRVGDAYYEQQLIRQQLLDQAGQRFILEGLTSENDQYKQLLESGVAAGLDLKLRVGVSLTPEQIASLDKDIVWMVETVVQGKKVLVPQLYLADTTRASLANGAKIVGANIDIQTTGDMTNSGAIVARNALNIDAGGTVTNRLGDISGGNVAITAVGDVLNQSGTIRGTDVSVTSTTG